MYLPAHFEQKRLEAMHDLMREFPLATVVTLSASGINANHVPVHLFPDHGKFGALHGHVARSNPMWSDRVDDSEALAIFHGPHAYISPSWYPTKREHGKVVPTWNYAVVHAYGSLRVIDDPVWLRGLLEELVGRYEATSAHPWSISDAPPDFVERMIDSVVGFEIAISRLEGKWKASQNQPAANRVGAAQGLRERGDSEASQMADLIEKVSRDGG